MTLVFYIIVREVKNFHKKGYQRFRLNIFKTIQITLYNYNTIKLPKLTFSKEKKDTMGKFSF